MIQRDFSEPALPKSDYYCYQYLRTDGTPYYIGKGRRYRAWSKHGHTAPRPKDNKQIQIIAKGLYDHEAKVLERKLIAFYGRKDLGTGILHNRTDGGDGKLSAICSAETRAKMSKTRIGKKLGPHTEEAKRKIGDAHKGKYVSDATRLKQSISGKGTKKPGVSLFNMGRKRSIMTCPHCNKTGREAGMKRHHFDHCKNKNEGGTRAA